MIVVHKYYIHTNKEKIMKRERKGTPTQISNAVLELMKDGNADWQRQWRNKRFITCNGHYLKGGNVVMLASLTDFYRTVWGTYDQWKYHGCQVKKGAKAVPLTVYKGKDENGRGQFGKYIAFNIEQCEGNTDKFVGFDAAPVNNAEINEDVESKLTLLNSNVKWHTSMACYNPVEDRIYIPEMGFFESATAYYSTRLHEEAHRTGHSSRLDRDLKGKFGDKKYAMEELIAELTACFMCIELGVISEPRKDHAQYLNSWIKLLTDDKRAFNIAVGKAQQATNYMLSQMGMDIMEENNG